MSEGFTTHRNDAVFRSLNVCLIPEECLWKIKEAEQEINHKKEKDFKVFHLNKSKKHGVSFTSVCEIWSRLQKQKQSTVFDFCPRFCWICNKTLSPKLLTQCLFNRCGHYFL